MKYVGLSAQIRKNNRNSILLLIAFPLLLVAMAWLLALVILQNESSDNVYSYPPNPYETFLRILPFVVVGTGIWFLIAWFAHAAMIRMATGSKPLERRENKRVYNLLENLCINAGMQMPKLYIIEDSSLNAFASGIDKRSYSISLSRGLIEKLDDEELEGVIAHELTHIRNRDVRVLIISIIFVGIFAFLAEVAFRSLRFGSFGKKRNGKGGAGGAILVAIVVTAIAYLISVLLRFGISRKREYLADAGASELTKKPYALASALRKISADPNIEAVENRDVAQLFIDNPTPSTHKSASWDNLFATHPPIGKRIKLLEQFV